MTSCYLLIKYFLSFFLLALALPLSGQQLTWSEPLLWETEEYQVRLIKSFSEGYWLLAQDAQVQQKYALAYYDEQLNYQHSKNLKAPKNGRLQKSYAIGDTIMLLFSQQGKDSAFLLGQGYSTYQDSLLPREKLLGFKGKKDLGCARASDSTLKVVGVSKETERLNFVVFNDQLEISLRSTIPLNKKHQPTDITEILAKGEATAFLAKSDEKNRGIVYYEIDSAASNLRVHPLGNDSLTVSSASLGYDRVNEQFITIGFYQLKNQDILKGLAFLKKGITSDDYQVFYEKFSQALVKRVYGQNTLKKGFENFKLSSLIPRSDGGAIVFLEAYQLDEKIFHDRGYFGTVNEKVRAYHYYEEIVVMAIDPQGNEQWSKVHRKQQTTVNDEGRFSSFSHMIQKKRLIFLYNSIQSDKMNLLAYTLRPGGQLKGKLLLKDRYDQLKAIPRKASQVGPGTVLMPALKNDKLHVLKVDFSR